jgi:hypothetical protein
MRQSRRIRSVIALILAGASLILAGCSCSTGAGKPGTGASGSVSASFVVSYAGAAGWLSGLGSAEAQEQLRDWARLGLASNLGMDTARLRDATYDTLPVRDAGFAGLARQDIGPGRYLYDGKGVLHVLVPRGDPHEARTVGLLLDQYRADASTDAPLVQLHYYRIDRGTDTISLTADPVEPTGKIRAKLGYVTMPVGTAAELTRFLARTSYLSRLELRGSGLWASGWAWPIGQSARISMADVSALQRGYVDAHRVQGQLPGFSLDPQRVTTVRDLLAVIPGLSPDMANRIITNNWAGSPFRSASDLDQNYVEPALFGQLQAATLARYGLPTGRTQLWALLLQLRGLSAYSQARYDGRLAGTAVGMTLFYTDYVAKTWVTGAGTRIPSQQATGFVPDTSAPTVWSQCGGPTLETGRLWFGENDSAVRFAAHGISLGQEPVRLYARTNGPRGKEVEPTYSFGRGLLWWDRHYQAIADYDPEYQRLDLIMRWSDAIDWLVSKTSARLPQLPDNQIPSHLTFADWYHGHDQLRERSPIDFVSPPAGQHRSGTWPTSYGESLAHLPSRTFMNCGLAEIEGGISLGNASDREGNTNYYPELPTSVSRAGTDDPKSTFNDIKEVSLDDSGRVTDFLERRFSTGNGADFVSVRGSARRVVTFGGLKVWRAVTALRTLLLTISARHGQDSEQVAYDRQDLGALEARSYPGLRLVTLQWRSGVLDRVRAALESVQSRLSVRPAAGLSAATSGVLTAGVLYEYQAPDGQTLDRVGGSGAPWLSISGRGPPVGDDLVLRGGAPDAGGSGPVFFYGKLVPGPGQRRGWLDVTPAMGGHAAVVRPGSPPPNPGDPSVQVTTLDGKTTTVDEQNGDLLVPDDDPILGLRGPPEGAAMLSDFIAIERAMREAAQARDGYRRAVLLEGDCVALVGAGVVTLVGPDDPRAAPVQGATASQPSQTPLILLEDNQALPVESGLAPAAGSRWQLMSLEDTGTMPDATYVNLEAFRPTLAFEDGPIITSTLPLDTKVIVRVFVATSSAHGRPDAWAYHNATWVRLSPRATSASSSTSGPTSTPTPGQSAEPPASGARILLVCPASASDRDDSARMRDRDAGQGVSDDAGCDQ